MKVIILRLRCGASVLVIIRYGTKRRPMFNLADLLFGCSHKHLSFPISTKPGQRRPEAAAITGTYVVCLECGKEFSCELVPSQGLLRELAPRGLLELASADH